MAFAPLPKWSGPPPKYSAHTASSSASSATPRSPGGFQSLRSALGSLGSFIIVGGTILTLCVLGFLIFLWTGEGPTGGQDASPGWRWFVLGQRITQVITLSTVLIRLVVAAQATVCTILIAAVVLEKHGIPLSKLAEVSVFRSINDGPLRMAWILMTSGPRAALVPTIATTVMLLGFVATQFMSTILVTDLRLALLVSDPRIDTVALQMSNSFADSLYPQNTFSRRPAFIPFGERNISEISPLPNQSGVSDTGILQRVFIPVPETNRTSLRSYQGKVYAMNSRFVCVRPVLEHLELMVTPGAQTVSSNFGVFISAGIDFNASLAKAQLEYPTGCDDGACFRTASWFNCTLPWVADVSFGSSSALCLPDGYNAYVPTNAWAINDAPLSNTSEVFVITRTNATAGSYNAAGTIPLPGQLTADAEWVTYVAENAVSIDLSLCFQQLDFDFCDARLSAESDLSAPSPSWEPGILGWNTTSLQSFLGIVNPNSNASDRGIYTVENIANSAKTNTTWDFTARLVTHIYAFPDVQNISVFLSPKAGGFSSALADTELQAVFTDVLAATNRPGVALQSMLTAMAGSAISEDLLQFDMLGNVTTASSVTVLTPRHSGGLVAVLVIVCVDIACAIAITWLFLTNTRFSAQGDFWHAVSQIVSPDTAWILRRSSQAKDRDIKGLLCSKNIVVRVGRAPGGERVVVMPVHPEDNDTAL
ncbi:hypothetical protein QBC46DRAFT_391210 [Diplogelasinospora grovesii]|uniref:Uncharacterized protein n=1 Tax=Diplogelasinospora grovesii TaxID=303347 RepID=A0AAN6N391_9PEZI|nr:hypothetical protein QBC46DRAFT_391210 [Diplogelasinospora grovesii]